MPLAQQRVRVAVALGQLVGESRVVRAERATADNPPDPGHHFRDRPLGVARRSERMAGPRPERHHIPEEAEAPARRTVYQRAPQLLNEHAGGEHGRQ